MFSPEFILTTILAIVVGVMGYLARRQIEKHEADDEDREVRSREFTKSQVDRIEASFNGHVSRMDASLLRVTLDVNAIGQKVNVHHDEMLRDYVHEDRLKERMESAVAPILSTLVRIERNLEGNVREIFGRLEKKMDR